MDFCTCKLSSRPIPHCILFINDCLIHNYISKFLLTQIPAGVPVVHAGVPERGLLDRAVGSQLDRHLRLDRRPARPVHELGPHTHR